MFILQLASRSTRGERLTCRFTQVGIQPENTGQRRTGDVVYASVEGVEKGGPADRERKEHLPLFEG